MLSEVEKAAKEEWRKSLSEEEREGLDDKELDEIWESVKTETDREDVIASRRYGISKQRVKNRMARESRKINRGR